MNMNSPRSRSFLYCIRNFAPRLLASAFAFALALAFASLAHAAFLKVESERWAKVVKAAGIKLD